MTILTEGLCDHKCVILDKEILDLLHEESVSGACSGRVVVELVCNSTLPRVFEKVIRPLKCHLIFGGSHTYL